MFQEACISILLIWFKIMLWVVLGCLTIRVILSLLETQLLRYHALMRGLWEGSMPSATMHGIQTAPKRSDEVQVPPLVLGGDALSPTAHRAKHLVIDREQEVR